MCTIDALTIAYFNLKHEAAPGVDGETWRHYGEALEDNLQDLSERLKRGAYRAQPVRRVYIAKTDGRTRPLGVTALEDKLVQRAVVEVMNGERREPDLDLSQPAPQGPRHRHRGGHLDCATARHRGARWTLRCVAGA